MYQISPYFRNLITDNDILSFAETHNFSVRTLMAWREGKRKAMEISLRFFALRLGLGDNWRLLAA